MKSVVVIKLYPDNKINISKVEMIVTKCKFK